MIIKIFSTLALFVATHGSALAQAISGNSLYAACEAKESDVYSAFCVGFIVGYVEGQAMGAFVLTTQLGETEGTTETNQMSNFLLGHCIPPTATNGQLRDVAVGYLRRHPETRHESARLQIWASLKEAFPCSSE